VSEQLDQLQSLRDWEPCYSFNKLVIDHSAASFPA
jgi:hypothetical protein